MKCVRANNSNRGTDQERGESRRASITYFIIDMLYDIDTQTWNVGSGSVLMTHPSLL